MHTNKISANTVGVTVSLFCLLVYLFIVYGLKSPTPRRMDALILIIIASSAFALILTEMFPRAYLLNLAVTILCGVLVLTGIVSIFTLSGLVAAKSSVPSWLGFDAQWLGVALFFGTVFALPVGVCAVLAYRNDLEWTKENPKPKKQKAPANAKPAHVN